MSGAQVCKWRDGLGVYSKQYADREDALNDLGVSRDELEQLAANAFRYRFRM